MQPFSAAPHHDVLVLLVQVAVLLFSARALGEVAQRLGQPSVVGEILAGILLGPSLLSGLVPAVGEWLVPQSALAGHLLEVFGLVGAMLLLLVTGLETDLALIRRHARTAAGASLGGVVVPLATGFALGWFLPDALLADPDERLVFALFVATAMSISAVPVIAKVLMDMGLMRREVGQTILAAGVVDDAIGWTLLSVVAGLAAGDAVTPLAVGVTVGKLVAFAGLTFTAGLWFVRRALNYVQDEVRSRDRTLTLVVGLMFVWGAVTQALGIEAVLGAFFLGMVFSLLPRLPRTVVHQVESLTLGIFAPVFFAVAGLKVNVGQLLTPGLLGVLALVIGVATFGKVAGVYAGARLVGRRDHWTALAMGSGMNARGAMEIIVATIGLSLGILTQDMFSIVVVMAMATSLMAPPALRYTLARVRMSPEEGERLRQEELDADSLIAQVRRVLLPVRQRASPQGVHRIEAHLVARLQARAPVAVTLLNVSDDAHRAPGAAFLERLADAFAGGEVARKVVLSDEPAEAILAEAAKHYQLLVLGSTEGAASNDALFNPVMDDLIRQSPCPTVVVRTGGDRPWPPKRILVPTNGTAAARHAAELAFLLATEPDEEVVVLTVVQAAEEAPAEPAPAPAGGVRGLLGRLARRRPPAGPEPAVLEPAGEVRESEARRQIAEALAERGRAGGANARASVEVGLLEAVVVETALREGIDLIVMGTDVKPGSDRLFLGPRVEHILRTAPCPVVIVNAS